MKISRDAILTIRKILIYFLIIFAAALTQTSFLAFVEPFGAVPDLALVLCLGVGYFKGAFKGGTFGLAMGLVCYTLGDTGLVLLPVLYGAVGVAAGLLVENFFSGKFAVWCLYTTGAALIKGGYSLTCIVVFSENLRLWQALFGAVVPEFVGTVILGAALYIPIKLMCKYL